MTVDDHDVAEDLATRAGAVLLALRAAKGFADGPALKKAGDLGSHEFLMAELAGVRPEDAVLSEEGKDDLARLEAERVWIVDPLDGTREYSEEGRDDWAVHVALYARGALAAGAVALPAQGRTLSTKPGAPLLAEMSARFAAPPQDILDKKAPVRIVVSRTRPPQIVETLREYLHARGLTTELVPMGSAGAKIAAVLLGDADVYVHAGGQYEWDNAAPAAVALAAGAHASRIDGSDLRYNAEDPYLPDILVCHPALSDLILAGVR
ncbi:3'(2'),5'-bisphosphate nucleotidase CysQ [Actinocorallia sp. API 0066]|uniref:inositol monophosphatase family protein n=1 Tax=Actinocorallia sp. API 0066 TaxID=2896846 RepID=UPI001E2B309A|nr:inositol monophosphatase family protein [Actinocorallia sp. API 0066]MCD0447802.1 3'(2'),5'-bisphosphate nucleotidase CysQ [Actinocorallia sp. API 0066]